MNKQKSEKREKNIRSTGIYIEKIENKTLLPSSRERVKRNTFSVLLVISGDMEIRTEKETVAVANGEGILLFPEKHVTAVSGEETGCQWIEVRFGGRSVPEILDYLELDQGMHFSFGEKQFTTTLDSMMTCQAAGEYFRAAILLQLLLVSVAETTSQDGRESELHDIYEYMTDHFQEPLDLTALAGMYGTSVSYFIRVFKQKYGQTPIQFLNHVRLRNARILLGTSNLTIREIAEMCGYEKPEYFCYVFKKQEGCTPTQFRIRRLHI